VTAPPFDPDTWTPPRRELLWRSPLNAYRGFGLVGRQLLLAAARAGIDVTLAVPPPRGDPLPSAFPVDGRAAACLGFSFEYHPRPDPLPVERLAVASAWEGTRVPRERVAAINARAVLLAVPCAQNRDCFRESGVRAPILVLPHGVDPARFPLLDRVRAGDEPYTFGTVGALSARKGIDVLVRAFLEEFAPREPARLILKSVDEVTVETRGDPRIHVLTGFATHDALLGLLRALDAFVLPSRAEGFGLCGLEAMATGLPTIATAWSGPADYLDPADGLPLRFRLVDAAGTKSNGVRYFGEWAEPDREHLRQLLRWLYEHREEGKRMGLLAAARVRRDWTWHRAAVKLRDALDLLARGVSPG
jgi:glycosyltransferase involved in cell wall biosynthesis